MRRADLGFRDGFNLDGRGGYARTCTGGAGLGMFWNGLGWVRYQESEEQKVPKNHESRNEDNVYLSPTMQQERDLRIPNETRR